jgi:hypothetical protein
MGETGLVSSILVCLMLYHVDCRYPAIYSPHSSDVISVLEDTVSAPPPKPVWWPLWTLVARHAG